jgi:hypothetical protein
MVLSDADEAVLPALRPGIRTVRREFAKLRRGSGRADGDRPARAPKALRARQSAAIRQVLTLLTQVVLADGRVTGELRWPTGADVEAALSEVIRVLGTRAATPPQELPSGALSGELPSGAESP